MFALAYMDQDVFSHWCHTFGLVGCQQIEIVELRSSRALSREELSKGQFLLVAINPPAIINSHWTRSYLHKCRQAYHHQHRHHHCYSRNRHHHQRMPPFCTIVKHHCQYCESCPSQVSWEVEFKCQLCFSCLSCLPWLLKLHIWSNWDIWSTFSLSTICSFLFFFAHCKIWSKPCDHINSLKEMAANFFSRHDKAKDKSWPPICYRECPTCLY